MTNAATAARPSPDGETSPAPRRLKKRERTRESILQTAAELIQEKGIEAFSVLDITEALGVSNGLFYYHFTNKDHLLEVLGHAVMKEMVRRIGYPERADIASRIARGPLTIFRQADAYPDQRAILRRVIEDPERLYNDLGNELLKDVQQGIRTGRFTVPDAEIAMQFCRSLIGTAIRLRHEGDDNPLLDVLTATQTLMMLGLDAEDAGKVVREERERVARD